MGLMSAFGHRGSTSCLTRVSAWRPRVQGADDHASLRRGKRSALSSAAADEPEVRLSLRIPRSLDEREIRPLLVRGFSVVLAGGLLPRLKLIDEPRPRDFPVTLDRDHRHAEHVSDLLFASGMPLPSARVSSI